MEGEELPLNERIDSMSDQEVGDALRNELASARAVLGSLDEATMTPYLEQQRAEAQIPLEEKDVEKYEPPEFIKSGLLGIAGAAGMAGSVVLAGAYLGGAGDWSVLASGAMAAAGIVQSGMGLNAFVNYALDRGRKQGLEPTMERVAEEAAMQRRPKRFAEGGDIWQSHPTMKPEHGALQDISGEFSIYDSKVENQHGRYSLYQKNPDYGREYWTIYDPSEMQIERQQAISDELQAHNARLRERGPSNIGSDESEAIQAARRALFAEQHALRQDATKMIADRNKHTGMPLTFYHGATEKDLEKSVPHYDANEEKQIDVQSPNTIRGSNSLDFIKQHAEKLIRQKEQGFDDNADYGDDDIPPRPDGPKEPPPDITPSSLQPSPSMSDAEATYASHMASGGDIGESSEIVNQTMFAPPDDIEDANFRIDSENDIPTLIPTAEDERDWRQQVMDSLDQEPQKDFEIPGSELDIDIPDEIMMAGGGDAKQKNSLEKMRDQFVEQLSQEAIAALISSMSGGGDAQDKFPGFVQTDYDKWAMSAMHGEDLQEWRDAVSTRSKLVEQGRLTSSQRLWKTIAPLQKKLTAAFHEHGGEMPQGYAEGGNVNPLDPWGSKEQPFGESHAEKGLPPEPGMPDEYYTGHRQYLERPQMAKGGTVPVLVEPGEKIESPSGNEEMRVPTLMGKPDSGDVVPMELPVGSHVKEKGQSQSDNVLQGDGVKEYTVGGDPIPADELGFDPENFGLDDLEVIPQENQQAVGGDDVMGKIASHLRRRAPQIGAKIGGRLGGEFGHHLGYMFGQDFRMGGFGSHGGASSGGSGDEAAVSELGQIKELLAKILEKIDKTDVTADPHLAANKIFSAVSPTPGNNRSGGANSKPKDGNAQGSLQDMLLRMAVDAAIAAV